MFGLSLKKSEKVGNRQLWSHHKVSSQTFFQDILAWYCALIQGDNIKKQKQSKKSLPCHPAERSVEQSPKATIFWEVLAAEVYFWT